MPSTRPRPVDLIMLAAVLLVGVIAAGAGLGGWGRAVATLTAVGLLAVAIALSMGTDSVVTSLRARNAQLDTALESMRQGLLLFDENGRLVLWNRRYLEMYRLPADAVKVGCSLTDLLRLRQAAGTFSGDPDQYIAKMLGADGRFEGDPDRAFVKLLEAGRVENKEFVLPDGRIVAVTNQSTPIAAGFRFTRTSRIYGRQRQARGTPTSGCAR